MVSSSSATALSLEDAMTMTEPTPTVPTLDLSPQDLTNLVGELRDYHAIYSLLFQCREQRAWALTYLHGLLDAVADLGLRRHTASDRRRGSRIWIGLCGRKHHKACSFHGSGRVSVAVWTDF
jgi:hypothetical protein